MRKKYIVFLPLFAVCLLSPPASAQQMPDNTDAFNSYQKQDLQQFKKQQAKNHASANMDAKKEAMDEKFQSMQKQFDENSKQMGKDNGYLSRKQDASENAGDDFKRNAPATSLGELKDKTAKEDNVTADQDVQDPQNTEDKEDDEDSSSFSSKLNGKGVMLFAGILALLGVMSFLYWQGQKPQKP